MDINSLAAYDAQISQDFDAKTGLASTIPPVTAGQAYRNLSALFSAFIGGILPADLNTVIKITNELNTVRALIAAGVTDGDAFINTVTEVLAAFSSAPESLDLITELNSKLPKSSVTASLVETVTGKAADATVIKTINESIIAIEAVLVNVAIKVDGKIDENDLPVFELLDYMSPRFFEEDENGLASIIDGLRGLMINSFKDGFSHSWRPTFGSSTVAGIGIGNGNLTGGASRAYDPASFLSSEPRIGLLTAATANSRTHHRDTILKYCGKYGYKGYARFCQVGAVAIPTFRSLFGFTTDTGGLAGVNPSTLLNIIIVGQDSEDLNMQIMHNDGAGVATKIDLGVNFPAKTRSTDIYDAYIHVLGGGLSAKVIVERRSASTGALLFTTEVTISDNLPDPLTLLTSQCWASNGSTLEIAELDEMFSSFSVRG